MLDLGSDGNYRRNDLFYKFIKDEAGNSESVAACPLLILDCFTDEGCPSLILHLPNIWSLALCTAASQALRDGRSGLLLRLRRQARERCHQSRLS